ncbi:hypothetical protein [Aeromicrobium marinum]|nr:hypothetical protein [Aeromicrobium marinum]
MSDHATGPSETDSPLDEWAVVSATDAASMTVEQLFDRTAGADAEIHLDSGSRLMLRERTYRRVRTHFLHEATTAVDRLAECLGGMDVVELDRVMTAIAAVGRNGGARPTDPDNGSPDTPSNGEPVEAQDAAHGTSESAEPSPAGEEEPQ